MENIKLKLSEIKPESDYLLIIQEDQINPETLDDLS
jgi:hypothetical protein